jgi:putative lipoprotein
MMVDEQRDLGKYGVSAVRIYYRNNQVLRFSEDATRVNYGGEQGDKPLHYSLQLDFAQGRFSSGTKTVNGAASTPDAHEISGALAQSKVALSRIDAILAQMNTDPADPTGIAGPKIFVCDDQSRFSVSFESRVDRAIVEFPGREPISLSRIRTGSGYGYGNDIYELRGKGQDAVWLAPSGDVHCAVSTNPVSLALAPGNFPIVQVAELKSEGKGIWIEHFEDLQPAIIACLAENPGDLVSVLKAWPMNHGMVGVRTVNGNGGRYDCLVPADGLGRVHTELVETTTNILPGEDEVRFTPASGAYPGGKCFSHERLEQGGTFVGWLSQKTC